MPHLCKAAEDSRIKGKLSISEVVGNVDSRDIADFVNKACEGKGKDAIISKVDLASLSPENKADGLAENGKRQEVKDPTKALTNLIHRRRPPP